MNRYLTTFVASLCLAATLGSGAAAQDYVTPQVVVSNDKVRSNGKIYYSHVVQERQTLYSICKAYNVTLQEIYDANPTLNLETEGLKKDQILLIPIKEGTARNVVKDSSEEQPQASEQATVSPDVDDKPTDKDYFIHRVRWFEDLGSISRKYGVSKAAIMGINGMTSEKVRRRDQIKIPIHPERWENVPTGTPPQTTQPKDTADKADKPADRLLNKIFTKGKSETSVSLLLPFNAAKKPDAQMMDFYSGVLLAAKDRGDDGSGIDLNVYDVAGGTMPVTEERFAASDFVIGPVTNADLARTVNASRGKAWIVSPLDPKAEALADTIPNVIQAPTPTKAQIKDMAEWIRSDMKASDKVILISQKGAAASSYSASVAGEVRNHGLSPENISFNILEGRQMMGRIDGAMTGNGTNRVVIASDSKAFVIEVTRLLYLIASQKKDIVLYGTSKIRTFDEIDVDQLHSLNLHCSVSYYVDYDSKSVQNFLMEYRALFNTEPSRSAFQGYDLMTFFTNLNSEYGGRWDGENNLKGKGLQSDFHLIRTARGGFVNEAVRRIVYKSDYTVSLVR